LSYNVRMITVELDMNSQRVWKNNFEGMSKNSTITKIVNDGQKEHCMQVVTTA